MTIQLPSAEERDASDLKPAGPIIIAGIAGLTIEEAFAASTEAENESRHKISSPKERKDTSSPLASSNALATHAQSLIRALASKQITTKAEQIIEPHPAGPQTAPKILLQVNV